MKSTLMNSNTRKSTKKGGGYYLDVSSAPIGGRSARGTYPNCCPPVFCSNLTGGVKKKWNVHNSVGSCINETDKLLYHLKKKDLNKIINKISHSSKKLFEYNQYFNKNIMRTLASTLLLDLFINKKSESNGPSYIKSLNNVVKDNSKFNTVIAYLNDIKINKKSLSNLHQEGGYSNILYPLGHYIYPVGANMFTSAAILFLMNMLNRRKNSKTLIGGVRTRKKDIVDKIVELIKSIHNLKITTIASVTKKNLKKIKKISKISKISHSIKVSKKKAKRHYRGRGGNGTSVAASAASVAAQDDPYKFISNGIVGAI
jgi:hypothetical protein